MRSMEEIKNNRSILIASIGEDGGCGFVWLDPDHRNRSATVVWSTGGGWDHVSVSYPSRTPGWMEMQRAKELFFEDEECVMQLHPKASEYVDFHPHCLHMWRPQGQEIPQPPSWMTGPKKGQNVAATLAEAERALARMEGTEKR